MEKDFVWGALAKLGYLDPPRSAILYLTEVLEHERYLYLDIPLLPYDSLTPTMYDEIRIVLQHWNSSLPDDIDCDFSFYVNAKDYDQSIKNGRFTFRVRGEVTTQIAGIVLACSRWADDFGFDPQVVESVKRSVVLKNAAEYNV